MNINNKLVPFGGMRAIEQQADNFLSNFGGPNLEFVGQEYRGGDDPYDGYGDAMVDFGEGTSTANSFQNEVESGRRFTVTLDNTANAAPKTMILNPSFDPSSPNIATDGSSLSIEGTAVIVTGQFKKLKALQEFIKYNPTRCIGFKMEATSSTQIAQSMKLFGRSPFRDLESEQVVFSDYRSSATFQDKIVEVNYKHQWDHQTEIQFVVAANTSVTVTFYFGGILNAAKGLRKKAAAAQTV